MKQNYEPGLVRTFQWLSVVLVILQPLLQGALSRVVGVADRINPLVMLIIPLLLLAYSWVPWFQGRLGELYLPIGLFAYAANNLFTKDLTLQWLTSPSALMSAMLLLTMRVWIMMQVVVVFIAWQYRFYWSIAAALLISLIDVAISLPFLAVSDVSLSLFVGIVVIRFVAVAVIGAVLSLLINRQRAQRQALADANLKLAQHAATAERLAVSQERIRLAQELHDTLAHSLTSITVQLEAAQTIWDVDQAKARALLEGALSNTRSGSMEARRALQALRAGPLEEVGLRVAVGNMARSTAARANLTLDLAMPDELPVLTEAKEQCVYRVAQEALSNVARHARATQVRVEVQHARGQLTLTVADNGRGFDPVIVNGTHFGLKGLRERAELVGGKLEIVSEPQRGTTLTLRAPTTEVES